MDPRGQFSVRLSLFAMVGLFDDGSVGEIFIKMAKEGSTLSGLIQGFCRAFSLCLQFGLPTSEACKRFEGMRFDPMGPTSNPDIPDCSSILDYVSKYLQSSAVTSLQVQSGPFGDHEVDSAAMSEAI